MHKSPSNISINYRPTSFSEGCVNYIPSSVVFPKDLTEPLIDTTKPDKADRPSVFFYLFKRSIMFMLHLGLISLFEIIFFFNIVANYEDKALETLINDFTDSIPNSCSNMTSIDKKLFTYVFNSIVNISQINKNANLEFSSRNMHNKMLVLISWMYFLGIIIINLLLLVSKFLLKIKINLLKIILDNLIMIIILGLYEFLFFRTIILNYQSISSAELSQNIINQFDTCLINNTYFVT